VGHNIQRSRELRICFRKNVLNLLINFFFIIQRHALLMYQNFDKSYKNQPLLLALGGCLEEKNRQINGA